MAERSIAVDCKSIAFGLRGFESLSAHIEFLRQNTTYFAFLNSCTEMVENGGGHEIDF